MTNPSPVPSSESPKPVTRREFIINLIMNVGAFLGLGSIAFRFAQFLYPVIPPVRFVEIFAAKINDIPLNGAKPFNFPEGRVMIANHNNQIKAYSAICTHLGCIYHWEKDKNRFFCPCHNGVYDIDGKVISGPPPRPLDPINTILRGDDIFLLMKSREVKV